MYLLDSYEYPYIHSLRACSLVLYSYLNPLALYTYLYSYARSWLMLARPLPACSGQLFSAHTRTIACIPSLVLVQCGVRA